MTPRDLPTEQKCFLCDGTGTRGSFYRETLDGEEFVPAGRCQRCGGSGNYRLSVDAERKEPR